MTPNATFVIAKILEDEGGIADVDDGKGITRFGQTPQWLADHGLPVPQTSIHAASNYDLWLTQTRIAEVVEWDADAGHVVADFAVHSGERTAIQALQRTIGTVPDGVIGPQTIAALAKHTPAAVARGVLAERLELIGTLLGSMTTDRRRWAKGWTARLARQIRTLP